MKFNGDNDILKLRQAMRVKIYNILQQKQPSSTDDASRAKYMDVASRLEEGLFKVNTKEDYMNQSTLVPRLTSLIKGRTLNNYNQRHANSSSVGTMIPTPGLQHSGGNPNLMVTSSVDAIQAHMSGQISEQVPNQGTMSQQNGNSQMQNLVGGGLGPSRVPVDNDILKLRQAMRVKIYNILQQKQPSPADDASKAICIWVLLDA